MVKATSVLPSWCKVFQKGQSTDSLLKKLKDLQSNLSALNDKPNDTTLDTLRDQLIKEDLLFHKDKEVRSSLACCLADLLRICAPDPPFDEGQLQTIFQFFLTVLAKPSGGLSKPNGPLFADAAMLLENLTSTKSILLMYELESADALIYEYFNRFFTIIKSDIPKKVELTTASMLAELAKEADVPKKAIELLLGHFQPAVIKTNPAASHLATLVCNEASNELQMHVNQYISDAIVKATSKDETPEMEQALHKIHTLIISINKSAPDVLVSILPQLEDGLRAENDTLREASVRTLGQMFAEKASMEAGDGNLARKYLSTWKTWLSRCVDKTISIRLAWIEAIRGLVIHHPELWTELELCITQKFIDPDEKVRTAMIKTFGTLDYDTLRHCVSRKILRSIGSRVLDKKESVRLEALEVLGRAFSIAYPEMRDVSVKEHFGWIPNTVLSMLSQGATLALVPVQKTLSEYILPLPTLGQEDEVKWTERYIVVLECLDDNHLSMLFKVSNLLDPRFYFAEFLEACKNFNGGVVDGSHEQIVATKKALLRPIELIAKRFPDALLAAKELNDFAKQNDSRAYKFLSTIMDSRSDLKSYVGALTVIKKKIHSSSSSSSSSGKTNETMAALVRMAGYPFVGTSSIPILLERLQSLNESEDDKVMKRRLFLLLKALADHDAAIFSKHTALLIETLQDSGANGSVIAVCLLALAKMQIKMGTGDQVELGEASIEKIKHYVKKGSHLEAKMAAKLLAVLASSQDAKISLSAKKMVEELSNDMAENLTQYNLAQLTASMAALKQFAKHANNTMLHLDDILVQNVVQHVLTQPWSSGNMTKKEEGEGKEVDDWIEDDEMNDELRARVTAIQFLSQRCLSNADDSEVVDTMIKPVLRLLFACLMHGQPSATLNGNASARARIRCVSAISLLKLARRRNCEKNITREEFQTFATTVQDETFQVRERFVRKLLGYWVKRTPSLPSRYYVLGFMTAFDPEEEMKNLVQSTTLSLLSVMTQEHRLKNFDIGLARLLHLLNHYPDFTNGGLAGLESLKNVAVYLDFYLECCANESNLACLYYIANRCKGHQDVAGPEASQGMYRLSELTMCLIKRRADAMGCNVGNWAGRVNLPTELYQPLPSRANQNEIYKRSYLSDEEADYFQQQTVRRLVTSAVKRKAPVTSAKENGNGKKRARLLKARSNGKPTPKSKRKSTKERREYEEESELSDAIVSDDEDEMVSEVDSEIQMDEEEISEDEEVESSADEAEGKGARLKSKLRKEKIARNESRAKKRQKMNAIAT